MALLWALGISCLSFAQDLPEGFEVVTVAENIGGIAGVKVANDSTLIVWSKTGTIRALINGELQEEVVLDISEEVAEYSDHGMLGVALDPSFDSNGLIYLLYIVDTHHLLYYGTDEYDEEQDAYYDATLGRISRYALSTSTGLYTALPESRQVLLGDSIHNGIPILTSSHGVGSLEFGSDGSLLASCGDGSTWTTVYTGGMPYPDLAFDANGLSYGVIGPDEDLGSYRSQYLDSYNGKVLRINPETGGGYPSNPYFDSGNPQSARSKVWALGLRNPFRACLRPGTGNSNPEAGDPGSLYIGDVGFFSWEEINVSDGPGLNFGWPRYEGMGTFVGYDTLPTLHPYFENPIFDGTLCTIPRYTFHDLVAEPVEDHNFQWPNPCENLIEIADTLDRFVHQRPRFAYATSWSAPPFDCLLPSYADDGSASTIPIEHIPSFSEAAFDGNASIPGDFYAGTAFPEEYFGALFQSDYQGWIRVIWFDENHRPYEIELFSEELGLIIAMEFNPYDEGMYMVDAFGQKLLRLEYNGNLRPVAEATSDVEFGPSPMSVQFDGSASFDPDGDPITFHWDFDDGQTSEQVSPNHTFTAPDSSPRQFDVVLQVTDSAGNSDESHLIISLNNTPPVVDITSISEGDLYPVSGFSELILEADVIDAEHNEEGLSYFWQTTLHHNSHTHPDPVDTSPETSAVLQPAGCEDNTVYFYEVALRVRDDAGLEGQDVVRLYPDCSDLTPPSEGFEATSLYPNPNRGFFIIRGPFEIDESFDIEITDSSGRIVFRERKSVDDFGRLSLGIDGLNQGLYLLRLSNTERAESLRLFIEQ